MTDRRVPWIEEGPDDDRLRVHVGELVVEIPARCPHRGGPLARGRLVGPFLRCSWHGATFDVRTGARLRGPICDDLSVLGCQGSADTDGSPPG